MKAQYLFVLVSVMTATAAQGDKGAWRTDQPRETRQAPPPPRVWQDPNYYNPWVPQEKPAASPAYVYDQKPINTQPAVVTPEESQNIIERFKQASPQLGGPRFLIYVNRELVDERSGMKLIKRQETIKSTGSFGGTNDSTIRSVGENTYRSDGESAPTLADKQTVRDVERLFGRPLRAAGAILVDQKVATQLIADRPLSEFIGSTDTPQARKDREALSQIADVVIEILVSSKEVTIPTISSSQTITVPDLQATAIRLKDSRILGQVSSADVMNRVPPASLGNFGVDQITEATALALMEDLSMIH